MGIDSSDYQFRENENLEAILRMLNGVIDAIAELQLVVRIESDEKQKIFKIERELDMQLNFFSLTFTTKELDSIKNELLKHRDDLKSLSIRVPGDKSGFVRMNYSQAEQDMNVYLNLPYDNRSELVAQLAKFLSTINEYSAFGPENESEIVEFAETIYDLNKSIRSRDKWKFETGCIDFEPINGKIDRGVGSKNRSINGLKVQYGKIHSLANKARGVVDLAEHLIEKNEVKKMKYHIRSESKSTISVINEIEVDDVKCYFSYSLKAINNIEDLEWIFQENECTIELYNCRFDRNDEFEFSIYLSGNSLENMDMNLFIDYRSPIEYKEKVLNLFEGRMHHVGDG